MVDVDISLDSDFNFDRFISNLDEFTEDIFQFLKALIYDSVMAQFGGEYDSENNIDNDVIPAGVDYDDMKSKIINGKNRRWAPLHDFTVSDKRRRGMRYPDLPLVGTGKLQESIKSYVTGNFEAQIGSTVSALASIIAEHEYGQRDPRKPISRKVLEHFGGNVPPLPPRSVIIDLAETFFDSVAEEIGDVVLNIFDKYW
jgi:hypothetical protein